MKYSKIKFNKNFKYRRIDDIIMAYDESSGNLFELNSTGAEIFEMIANGMQIEEIETSSEESSAKLGKTINEKKLLEKIDLIRKYGIQVHTSFIVGVPGDTEKNLEMTIDLVKKINPTLASFNRLFIFPGTNLYNNPESYDIIMDDKYWYESEEWTKETTMGTKQLPPEKIKCWYNKLQLSYIMNK